ncbi:50S ribosomal protein L13 [Elusimicrobiota bacterium]
MNNREWYIISASKLPLGRLSTMAAGILMGKGKVDYSPHEDKGGFLIVTDAEQVQLSGTKKDDKEYFYASTYPGNSRSVKLKRMQEKRPDYIVRHAVKGMLPKNKLASRMINRLKVYVGSEHPHQAQNPVILEN